MTTRVSGERKSSTQQQPSVNPSPNQTITAKGTQLYPKPLPFSSSLHNSQKKMPRRSSKPIINWFQRKLAGTVKGKRSDTIPLSVGYAGRGASRNNSRASGRMVSSPVPNNVQAGRQNARLEVSSAVRRKTISLNGDGEFHSDNEDDSLEQVSLAVDSLWSPTSVHEADDDASVRPIPPSAPPSPAPSRSSSSYLSDPRTFRSIAASTKPTTVLSIDLPGNGMAHIAQVPVTPTTQGQRFNHFRQSSSSNTHTLGNPSVSFSAIPSQSSRGSTQAFNYTRNYVQVPPVQAPLHTSHHPRNNPRPSSPPLDNASVLTLASSAYALPNRMAVHGWSSSPPSAFSAGDSISHLGGNTWPDAESMSQFVPADEDRLDERDVDASVRALRPRSSRRGSWGSEVSGWSAEIPQVLGTPSPSLSRERSVQTHDSNRSEEAATENGKVDEEDHVDISSQVSPRLHGRPLNDQRVGEIVDRMSCSSSEMPDESNDLTTHRSPSLDTVNDKANAKDLSIVMSRFALNDDEGKASPS